MIRLATCEDAEQLYILNEKFNGEGETVLSNIQDSLLNNRQEIVVVAETDNILVGFICVQLKKTFCYDECMPEMTEVFVDSRYRRRGYASRMIAFAEDYCKQHYPIHKIELLTGKKNFEAQALYQSLGYCEEEEMHLVKRS